MSDSTKALREERSKLVADMRALLDKAEAEKRDMTDEESKNYDEMESRQSALGRRIERLESQRELDRQMAERAAQETEERLERLLAGLDARYREVLSLRCYCGMSHREIAEAMELPSENTANALFLRARKALQRQWESGA